MGDIKNIPELNFGLSSTEWNEFELGKITVSYSGGTPQAGNPVYYGGDIPFIRSGEISNDSTSLHITQAALENSSAKLVEKGDILYALYGATSGEVSRSQIDGAINQAVMAIKPDDGFDFEFITQLLRKNKKKIISTFLQGGQGNLSGAIIKSLVFKFPEKTKQIQIGTFFKNLDNHITLKQRKLDKLVTLKKAMLEKMFPKEGADEPEIRFTGFSGAWEKKTVGDFYEFKNGLNKAKEYFGKGSPIVNFTDVFHCRGLTNEQLKGKVTVTKSELKSFDVKRGDIFFTRTSETIDEIGYPSVILEEVNNTVFSGFVLRCRAISEEPLSILFKQYVFFNQPFRKEMTIKSSMTTRALTSGTAIKKMQFSFPSDKKEQHQIGLFFKNLDELISLKKTELTKLKQIKSSCLEKMFV